MPAPKSIEVILAATVDGEIGYKNTIPWRLKGDLKRFREMTMGNILIMGKNTYQSLPKAMDGRIVIVVSKTLAETGQPTENVFFTNTLLEAIRLAEDLEGKIIFIAGGAKLYEAGLKIANKVHLTQVYKAPLEGYDTVIENFSMKDFVPVGHPEPCYEVGEKTGLQELTHIYMTYVPKPFDIPHTAGNFSG